MTGPGAERVVTGLERVVGAADPRVVGPPIGLVTHPAAVLPDLTHSLDALLAVGADVRAVFGSEHGFRGTAQAGFAEAPGVDEATGLPVFDTYGLGVDGLTDQLRAAGIEVLVVDLQHVGARFYTYESTLYDLLGAAARAGVRVVVLDRPNPVGGVPVQGPVLEPGFASFVGRAPVAVRHGMTMGELAGLFAGFQGVPGPEVVTMRGWRRASGFGDTGLPWVPPSPNMPTPGTALVYPGLCLVEGTNLSCGRGTTTPFELVGAPWLDRRWAAELRGAGLAGVAFREAYFSPAFHDYAGEWLCGVQVHVTDPAVFDPLATVLTLLAVALDQHPAEFAFRERTFDLLAGSDRVRSAVAAGRPVADVMADWQPGLRGFRALREPFLRYSED